MPHASLRPSGRSRSCWRASPAPWRSLCLHPQNLGCDCCLCHCWCVIFLKLYNSLDFVFLLCHSRHLLWSLGDGRQACPPLITVSSWWAPAPGQALGPHGNSKFDKRWLERQGPFGISDKLSTPVLEARIPKLRKGLGETDWKE